MVDALDKPVLIYLPPQFTKLDKIRTLDQFLSMGSERNVASSDGKDLASNI